MFAWLFRRELLAWAPSTPHIEPVEGVLTGGIWIGLSLAASRLRVGI